MYLIIKRILDIIFAAFAFIFYLPIFVIIAIAVKLDSHGPIFFGIHRIGKGGKSFMMYKYRTMYMDSEERLKKALESNNVSGDQWQTNFKTSIDPRITRVGKFLRRTALDELPLFINILRGDLSIVGPRPGLAHELTKDHQRREILLHVRPGMVGPWTPTRNVKFSTEEIVNMETEYAMHPTFKKDIIILYKAVIDMLLGRRGAY